MRTGSSNGGVVQGFEDLIAWQRARELTKAIYGITRLRPLATDLGLADQLRRASVSIMSNIAEGFDRGSRAEFHRFLSIAKGSCGETRSLLVVASDAGYLDGETFDRLKRQANETARVIGGLRATVSRQRQEPTPDRTAN